MQQVHDSTPALDRENKRKDEKEDIIRRSGMLVIYIKCRYGHIMMCSAYMVTKECYETSTEKIASVLAMMSHDLRSVNDESEKIGFPVPDMT
jgi:hypothetical protein